MRDAMSHTSTYDVAIVGYGPVGATAANLLGQMGLRVVVIERDPDIYFRARAISIDEEVLRIWQQVGLADRLGADMQPGAGADFVDTNGVSIAKLLPADRGNGHPRSNSSTNRQSKGFSAVACPGFRTSRYFFNTSACVLPSAPTPSS